jgi:Domain of unknown function (DUF4386)
MNTISLTDLKQSTRSHSTPLRTTGGMAALILGALFTALLVILAGILPGQGFGPGALNDPATGIKFLTTSPWPMTIASIYLGVGITFVLIALAVEQWFKAKAPALMQLLTATGLIAGTLFLAYAMINLIGSASIVSTYQHDPASGAAIYLALRVLGNGLNSGALFAAGLATLLMGWAGFRTGQLPKILGGLLIVAGICTTLSFAMLPLGLLGVLLAPIWSIWLGIVLLRASAQ